MLKNLVYKNGKLSGTKPWFIIYALVVCARGIACIWYPEIIPSMTDATILGILGGTYSFANSQWGDNGHGGGD